MYVVEHESKHYDGFNRDQTKIDMIEKERVGQSWIVKNHSSETSA